MMILVIGGSGSGKSSYAEKIVVCRSRGMIPSGENFSDINMKRYYLATMQIFDEEGYQKAERHRKLRSKKEFLTIEQPTQIQLRTLKSSRASNVLTITGSGTHEKMGSTQGKPGVYLLFQGAEYYHGFNEMISDHCKEGTSRQVDGIWEYYERNSSKSIEYIS